MKKLLRGMAHAVGLEVHKYRPTLGQLQLPYMDVLDLIINQEMAKKKAGDWTFMQFGAHDGQNFDPINQYIRKHHWRGVLVEPQPKLFERLKKTYASEPQLIFENAAVAPTDGPVDFYCFKDDGSLPYHATMLASFNREAVEHNMHGYRGEVINLRVPGVTVATLLKKHDIKHLDLLQIDTEGFDWEVMSMFAKADCWPTIVHFENWGALDSSLAPYAKPWIEHGYGFLPIAHDMLCYRQSTLTKEFHERVSNSKPECDAMVDPLLASSGARN